MSRQLLGVFPKSHECKPFALALPLHCATSVRHLLLVLPLVAGGCLADALIDAADSHDCVEHHSKDLSVADPADDAAMQFHIDQCKVDADACSSLCSLAMQRASLGVNADTCNVKFGSATVKMTVHYTVFVGGNGCAIPEQPGFGGDVGAPKGGGL
jgi:hypothetical protein